MKDKMTFAYIFLIAITVIGIGAIGFGFYAILYWPLCWGAKCF